MFRTGKHGKVYNTEKGSGDIKQRNTIKEEQKYWDTKYPHLKREVLAIDNGKNYGNFKAPDGNYNNIFTTRNSDKDPNTTQFIWRYRR